MLADQTILRIPGPTPIPPSVERAMNIPMVGHRSSETSDLIRAIQPKLQPIFGTNQDVVILAGSGTAALEAAVVNAVRPLDEVLVIVTGAFGARFVDICEAYGIRVHQLQVEWEKQWIQKKSLISLNSIRRFPLFSRLIAKHRLAF